MRASASPVQVVVALVGAAALCWAGAQPIAAQAAATCNGRTATITGSGTIIGTEGDDVIVGSDERDEITGLGGNDTICALAGEDSISDGPGNDFVFGGAHHDRFIQGTGKDLINGGGGGDQVDYSARTARVVVTLNDTVDNDGQVGEHDKIVFVASVAGGSGNDALVASNEAALLQGNAGNDVLTGGSAADLFDGGLGNDVVNGGAGNDRFYMRYEPEGTDVYRGQGSTAGGDTVYYYGRTVKLSVSLDGVANDGEAGEGDNLIGIETVFGGGKDDTLTGSNAAERLHGYSGHDTISGGGGDDYLYGDGGKDVVSGGTGADYLNVADASGNDSADGGVDSDEDTASYDLGDTITNVP